MGRVGNLIRGTVTLLVAACAILAGFEHSQAQEQPTSQGPTDSRQAAGEPSPTSEQRKKPKKVWTNDDMGEVKTSPVSELGQPSSPGANRGAHSSTTPSPQMVASYRKQLATLQAQQSLVEKQ